MLSRIVVASCFQKLLIFSRAFGVSKNIDPLKLKLVETCCVNLTALNASTGFCAYRKLTITSQDFHVYKTFCFASHKFEAVIAVQVKKDATTTKSTGQE